MQIRLSIATKLFFAILLILVVSYPVLIFTTIRGTYLFVEEKIAIELEQNLKYVTTQYQQRAASYSLAMRQPASSPTFQERVRLRDEAWLRSDLMRWKATFPAIDLALILDNRQKVLARHDSTATGDTFFLSGFVKRAVDGEDPSISTELVPTSFLCREDERICTSLGSETEVLMTTIVTPIVSETGEKLGAIVLGDVINRDPQLPFQVQAIFGKEVEVTINQRGKAVASTLSEHGHFLTEVPPEAIARLSEGKSYFGSASLGTVTYRTAIEPIANGRGEIIGSFAVAIPQNDIVKVRQEYLANLRMPVLFGIFLSFLIAWLAARKMTGPLRELAKGARMIEQGELHHRVGVTGRDEIGQLAESFNRMAESLAERDRIITAKTHDLQELNDLLERRVSARTAELMLEMGRLEAILTSMAEGVVVTDREDCVIVCNPAALRIFGLAPHRILYRPIGDVNGMSGFSRLVTFVKETGMNTADADLVREEELEVGGKKLKINLTHLLDERSEFAGVVMSLRDVTAEEELDRMKNEFISTVSHELKTPLTSIKGAVQFVLNKGKWLTTNERELLTICLRNTDRLVRLISDILDISRIEAGSIQFTFRPISVNELVTYSIDEIKGYALSHNIQVINRADPSLPLVYGDFDRLVQVVANLLSNAIKFSPEGKLVTVETAQEANFVTISVLDTGATIPLSERSRLFRKFQRLQRTGHHPEGGTGLGLAICREIVERHHGKMEYTPAMAGGNIFSFTVPILGENV